MISIFRRHLQGRALRYVVYFVSILVIFPYSITYFMRWFNVGGGNWAIKVDGAQAGHEEYMQREQEVERQIAQIKSMMGDNASRMLAAYGLTGDTKTIVLNNLTMKTLFNATARSLGIHVSSAYIQLAMTQQLPRNFLLPNGEINRVMVEQAYHMPFEQFEREQTQRIKEELIVELADGALYVPQFVLRDYFIRQYVNHKFVIAQFPLARFIEQEKKQPVLDKDLQDFFVTENRKNKRYLVPERRSGIAWVFNPDQYGISVSDNQISRYYERNKATEFVASPAKIQVRALIVPFSATTKSQANSAAQQLRQECLQKPEIFTQKGKLLDFFARGTHEQLFEQQAFRLATDGAISPVFETKDGYTILQRVARKAAVYKPLDSVRNHIIHKLRVEQFTYSFPHMIRRIIAQENKEKALADFARERGAQKQVISNRGIDQTPLMQKLFNTRLNGVSSFVDEEKGTVLLVNQVQKAYEPSLEHIKARVTVDYYHAKAERTVKNLLRKADVINSLQQFQQFAQEHGVPLERTGWIHAHAQDQVNKKFKELFDATAQRFFTMTEPGSVAVYIGSETGYAVCLEALAPFDEQEFEKHKDELAFSVLKSQRMLIGQGFVASLCRNATIKVHEKIRT